MRAALVQAQPRLGDVDANAKRIVQGIREADADLVVFPELFLSGYPLQDHLRDAAEPLDGPHVRDIAEACRQADAYAVWGMPRVGEARGVIHNSAVMAGPDGRVAAYDKVYLPTFSVFEEDVHFGEGHALPVFETELGRIGLTICYDLFFPEVTKALALQGADVIVNISASPTTSKGKFEAIFPARAIETTSALLYTNNVGPLDQVTFWGGAQAWGPGGERIARGPDHEEATTLVELDLDDVEEARFKRPVVRDTRGEVLDLQWEAWKL